MNGQVEDGTEQDGTMYNTFLVTFTGVTQAGNVMTANMIASRKIGAEVTENAVRELQDKAIEANNLMNCCILNIVNLGAL